MMSAPANQNQNLGPNNLPPPVGNNAAPPPPDDSTLNHENQNNSLPEIQVGATGNNEVPSPIEEPIAGMGAPQSSASSGGQVQIVDPYADALASSDLNIQSHTPTVMLKSVNTPSYTSNIFIPSTPSTIPIPHIKSTTTETIYIVTHLFTIQGQESLNDVGKPIYIFDTVNNLSTPVDTTYVDSTGHWELKLGLYDETHLLTASFFSDGSYPSAGVQVSVDSTMPIITTDTGIPGDQITQMMPSSIIMGTCSKNATEIILQLNGATIASGPTDDGIWGLVLPEDLDIQNGENVFRMIQKDSLGNFNTNIQYLIIDNTPPEALSFIDVERIGNQDIITGTAEIGSTIKILSNNITVSGSILIDQTGHWKTKLSNLDPDTSLSATQTDIAGNVSPALNFQNTVLQTYNGEESIAPQIDLFTSSSSLSPSPAAVLPSGYSISWYLNGDSIASDLGFNWDYLLPSDGAYQLKEVQTGPNGKNTSLYNIILDTTPPPKPVITEIAINHSGRQMMLGTAEPYSTVQLVENIDSTPQQLSTTADGNGFWKITLVNTISSVTSIIQLDLAGNASANSVDPDGNIFLNGILTNLNNYSPPSDHALAAPKITAITYMDATGASVTDTDILKIYNQITHSSTDPLQKILTISTLSDSGYVTNHANYLVYLKIDGQDAWTGRPNNDGTINFNIGSNNFSGPGSHSLVVYGKDGNLTSDLALLTLNIDPTLLIKPIITDLTGTPSSGLHLEGTFTPNTLFNISQPSFSAGILSGPNGAWSANVPPGFATTSATHGSDIIDLSVSGTPGFIMGNAANNTITIADNNFKEINGGAGNDTLVLGAGKTSLDFSQLDPTQHITQIEKISMKSGDYVNINLTDVLDMNAGPTHQILFSSSNGGSGGNTLAVVDLHTNGASHTTNTDIVNGVLQTTYTFTYNAQQISTTFNTHEVMVHLLG